jgi:GTPase SAR1 family protein
MTAQLVLSPQFQKQYDALRDLIQRALLLANQCSDSEASRILMERLGHLQTGALLVVVGEVNSGKSSFINALLGEDICEVAPEPCTAVIQELVYGEERVKTDLGDHWQRLQLPKDVLRQVSIIDTPGTNSIIRNHQAITENYIPQSDLVIFVLFAKNPHTGTAWDLLSLISKDWHRKTVFVLQQADTATQHELAVSRDSVRQYAHEHNVQNPVVFTLSAKREMEGASDSGFPEFREFFRRAVESGEAWRIKLEGGRDTVGKIMENLLSTLRKEESSIAEDKAFYRGLLGKMQGRREKAFSLKRLVLDSLCSSYDRLCSRLEGDFSEGLRVGNILMRSIPLIRDKDLRMWVKDLHSQFEKAAAEEIAAESARASKDICAEMQEMLDDLNAIIARRQENYRKAPLPLLSDRSDILERLRNRLCDLRISDIVRDKDIQSSELGKLTLAGGGIAALGAVIALATKLIVFDITGGILAALGIGLVAVTLLWKRSSILQEFAQKLENSRVEFRERLDQEITDMFNRLFLEFDHHLKDPVSLLEKQASRIECLLGEAGQIKEAADRLR